MKKILFIIVVTAMFGACKSKTDSDEKNLVPLNDQKTYNNNELSDTPGRAYVPKDSTITTTTVTVTKTPVMQSKQANTEKKVTAASTAAGSATVAQPQKKKGWSKAAKGTAIGAGAGAVTGAVVGRNAKGAIIGGVVGAAGGYIIGRSKDKKDGRVKKDSL